MDAVPPSFDDVLDPDSLQLSQDGTQLAAMHGTQILIWDVADGGAPRHSIGEATHPTGVVPLAATPDFSQFAIGDADAAVTIVSSDGDGHIIELAQWHEHEQVEQLEISPDGQRLAVRGSSGLIVIVSMTDHDLETMLPACSDSGGKISFSPDSSKLFAASRHDGSRLAVSATAFGHGPDDHWNLTLMDTTQWEKIRTYPELSPVTTTFFPDDDELLVADGSTSILRWQIGSIPEKLSTRVVNYQAHLAPDGSAAYLADRETLVAFELDSAETLATYDIPDFQCSQVANPQIFEECL